MVQRDVHPDFFLLLPDLFFCYQIYSSATRFILLLPVARDLDCISEKERMGGGETDGTSGYSLMFKTILEFDDSCITRMYVMG